MLTYNSTSLSEAFNTHAGKIVPVSQIMFLVIHALRDRKSYKQVKKFFNKVKKLKIDDNLKTQMITATGDGSVGLYTDALGLGFRSGYINVNLLKFLIEAEILQKHSDTKGTEDAFAKTLDLLGVADYSQFLPMVGGIRPITSDADMKGVLKNIAPFRL